jgi:hypothetical protein
VDLPDEALCIVLLPEGHLEGVHELLEVILTSVNDKRARSAFLHEPPGRYQRALM